MMKSQSWLIPCLRKVDGRTVTTLNIGSRQRPIYALIADTRTTPTSNRSNIMDRHGPKCREKRMRGTFRVLLLAWRWPAEVQHDHSADNLANTLSRRNDF